MRAVLQQALEALEARCGTNADERKELIPAIKQALEATCLWTPMGDDMPDSYAPTAHNPFPVSARHRLED